MDGLAEWMSWVGGLGEWMGRLGGLDGRVG